MSAGDFVPGRAAALVPAPRVFELSGKVSYGPETEDIFRAIRADIDRGVRYFLMDLSGAPDIDSAGIGFLVECLTAVRRVGGTLALAAPSKRIIYALLITRLDGLFPAYDTIEAALTSQRA